MLDTITTIHHLFRFIAQVLTFGVAVGFILVIYSLFQGERTRKLASQILWLKRD
jgi:hypothetical protein